MRKSLFKKAAQIVKNNEMKIVAETDRALFFERNGEKTDFYYAASGLKHVCDCLHMVKNNPDAICSHKLAAFYLAIKEELDKL